MSVPDKVTVSRSKPVAGKQRTETQTPSISAQRTETQTPSTSVNLASAAPTSDVESDGQMIAAGKHLVSRSVDGVVFFRLEFLPLVELLSLIVFAHVRNCCPSQRMRQLRETKPLHLLFYKVIYAISIIIHEMSPD